MENRIVILGAGESGVGAAMLAHKLGYTVWVSDMGQISMSRKEQLIQKGIAFEEGAHSEAEVLNTNEIIKSPGIPLTAPIVQKAIAKGINIIDELEFAGRHSEGQVIGITGTNGKTTTSLLTYHLLQKGGLDVGLAGNVGQSWAGQLVDRDHAWWVLEMSSFQLDGLQTLKPKIGILTNITPDHLDRYDYDLSKYVASKLSLFKRMANGDAAIFLQDSTLIREALEARGLFADPYPVSTVSEGPKGGYFDGLNIKIATPGKTIEINPKEIVLKGKHNLLNAMMSSLAAALAGVEESSIKEGLMDFKNAAHRMEPVGIIDGISFVNDSKGTNVDATKYALESFEQPVIWIAGGVDKGNDYTEILPLIDNRIKALICLGKDNKKLKEAFDGRINEIRETTKIEEAVKWGLELGSKGEVVLLSPACASFDLFKNYEDRGQQFSAAVGELKSERK